MTEAANDAGEEFGLERLAGMLDGGAESLPERWRSIMENVRQFANGHFADDATLLLISVAGDTKAELVTHGEAIVAR